MASFKTVCEVMLALNEIDSTIHDLRDIASKITDQNTEAIEDACDLLEDYKERLKRLPIGGKAGEN